MSRRAAVKKVKTNSRSQTIAEKEESTGACLEQERTRKEEGKD